MTHPNPEPVAKLYAALKKLLPARYAVVGAYAYAVAVEPRETQDIDILLSRRDARALANALAALDPEVTTRELPFVIRVYRAGSQVVDLIVADHHPLHKNALKNACIVRTIPRFGRANTLRPEALIAFKYMAACGEHRERLKKIQDLHDMLALLKATKHVDEPALAHHLSLIYSGAEKDFAKLRDDFEKGRPITI